MLSRRPALFATFVIAAGFALCQPVPARAQSPAAVPAESGVLSQLTPEETRAAGLEKLSPQERAALDTALNRYLGVTIKKSTDAAVARRVAVQQVVIESRVAGVFHGLTGRTRILLENGQVWRQANTEDKFAANIDHPDVVIIRGGLGYVMRIGGINGKFYATQVTGH